MPRDLDSLLLAFKQLPPAYPEAQLIIAGDGRLRSYVENSIRIHELHRHVCPLGQQDDIPALMGVADQLAMLLLFDDPTFRQRLGAAPQSGLEENSQKSE
jgi:glycosyltransferase involved in cell wall biosynthesis